MSRCEGYYRVENRRCDREAIATVHGEEEGEYAVCEYHRRESRPVARWVDDTDRRLPTAVRVRAAA